MGIKGGLFSVIKKRNGYKNSIVKIDDMNGKIIAVDVSHLMYCANYQTKSDEYIRVVRYFVKFITKMFNKNIIPIMVFDGAPSKLKSNENVKRGDAYKKNVEKLANLKKEITSDEGCSILTVSPNLEKYRKLKRIVEIKPTKDDNKSLIKLFNMLNIPWIITNNDDAEKFCSWLSKHDYVDYIIANDSDCMVFGGKNIIYKYSHRKSNFEIHIRQNVLNALEFTHEHQMIHYAMLLGNDYNARIKGYGPVKSRKCCLHQNPKSILVAKLGEDKYKEIYEEFTGKCKMSKTVEDFIKLLKSYKSVGLDKVIKKMISEYTEEKFEKTGFDGTSINILKTLLPSSSIEIPI